SPSQECQDAQALGRDLSLAFWSCVIVPFVGVGGVVGRHLIYLRLAAPTGLSNAFGTYIQTLVWSTPSIFFYFVLQRYWQARHRVLAFTAIMLLGNALNLGACLALGLGHWGFPRLEVRGLALATVISRYAMLLAAA